MAEFFIDGRALQAEPGQTVMQAAAANGIAMPAFCWHPQLSAPGNCRVCAVEVEPEGGGGDSRAGWVDIACNMPVTPGMRVRTDTERVRARRRQTLQFVTLNHPVDCGICDKAGECTLQDLHFAHNGAASISREPKLHATKHVALSSRIVLDNERCILCTRCVRFTHEISGSNALGIQQRADHSLLRAAEDGSFERDAYSDNVIDICPVGALLSRPSLHKLRVWFLQATKSVCPGCERGCSVDIWHRKPEWALQRLDARANARIDRVTPRDNPAVNGPWVCNKARDLALLLERPRAAQPMLSGRPVELGLAIDAARTLIGAARHAVALVSSWASNEELAAFARLSSHFASYVKVDCLPAPDERIEDALLIKPDKNPNRAGALALFAALPDDPRAVFAPGTDLVLVWGEGFDAALLPPDAQRIQLNAFAHAENSSADVFIPTSLQTERAGHYTNFAGVVSAFDACFAASAPVAHAEQLFAALAPVEAPALR